MKIAVDFDGTCVDHRYPEVGEDAPLAVETLLFLHERGDQLFLHTMRHGKELEDAVQWFVQRGIPLSGIGKDPGQTTWTQSPKCYAEVYIDDAALGAPMCLPAGFSRECIDWKQVQKILVPDGMCKHSGGSNAHGNCFACGKTIRPVQ